MYSTLTLKSSANSAARISAVSGPHVTSIRVQFFVNNAPIMLAEEF
jgi:hypothetical protein